MVLSVNGQLNSHILTTQHLFMTVILSQDVSAYTVALFVLLKPKSNYVIMLSLPSNSVWPSVRLL